MMKMFLLLCSIWFVIGFISAILISVFIDGKISIRSIFLWFVGSSLGGFILLYLIVELYDTWPFPDKVLWHNDTWKKEPESDE